MQAAQLNRGALGSNETMERLAHLFLLVALVPGRLACQGSPTARQSVTGSYELRWPEGSGCNLRVQQLSDSLRFDFDCWRGGPSPHTGEASGTIALADRQAVYSTTEFGGQCEIRFSFTTGAVVVKETESFDGACGFGFDVHADGPYRRTSERTPVFGDSL